MHSRGYRWMVQLSLTRKRSQVQILYRPQFRVLQASNQDYLGVYLGTTGPRFVSVPAVATPQARGDDSIYFDHSGTCRDDRLHRNCPGRWRGAVSLGWSADRKTRVPAPPRPGPPPAAPAPGKKPPRGPRHGQDSAGAAGTMTTGPRIREKISARRGASAARGRLREPTRRRNLNKPGRRPTQTPAPLRQPPSRPTQGCRTHNPSRQPT